MSDSHAVKRIGLGMLGALLAGGLLVAACAVPDDRPRSGAGGCAAVSSAESGAGCRRLGAGM
ncbi:hypothetical protein [Streptomyces sp. RerS4]|uniref:hypothetical protein n=1 Tax=Streptomyces sp. RerS4 TaxID=2942449 RepID=UPI00201C24DB|nr:hypothetical protein [Streptomyces sp. RerS4]UQX03765.1 hypothetical protein M4D82_27160 [Streptomyces sp. RerS4]